ncbi:MAG TPA: hypothetical protein VHY22_04160 [Chthoniobacteraceae bacterium]|jgi:hypothetical protein|nr:hypothetical protein [Chthoniobacteraceae bacterium]
MISNVLRLFGLGEGDIQRVSSVSLQLRNAEALGWLVFILMLLGAFAWWSYHRQEAHRALSAGRRKVLLGLRLTLFALIVMLLLRPVLALDLQEHIRRTVLLMVDATKSMNIRDQRLDETDQKRAEIGMGVLDTLSQPLDAGRAADARQISRVDLVKAVLQNQNLRLIENLRKEFNVETWTFAQTASPVDSSAWLVDYRATGNTTAIGDSVRGVLDRKRGQPVAGIVLITDGGNNAGSPPAEAAEAAARDGVPIYAYGVGITSPRDIIVSHLSAPEIAFAQDEMSVSVQVRGQGLAGETGKLSLKLGDNEVATKDVAFTGADQIVSMSFTPQIKGEFELSASIPPRDDETSRDNNSAQQRVRVVDSKIKVLYIEQKPRWEFRFLEEVLLRDRRIQPSFVLLDADPGITQGEGSPYLAKFPDKKEDLFKYDMVIVGDVDPKTFAAAQLDALGEFVSKFGGAALFIAGRSYMPEAYRGSIVEKMLPVELEPYPQNGETTRPIHLALTPLGQSSDMLRLTPDPEQNAELWAKLPPVYWDFKVARPKAAAQTLVEDTDPSHASRYGNMPVFASQQYGVGQVFYLGTDQLWRWRRGAGVDEYPMLWGQIVQGAALAHLLGSSKKTQLSVDKEEHNVGDPVTVFARLYNDTFQPISDPQVQAQFTVITGTGTQAATPLLLRAVPDQPGMYRGDFVALTAGRYQISTVNDPGTVVEFNAREPQFELGETAMNESLLRQMAAMSGGRFFREEDLSGLVKTMTAKPETLHTSRDLEIWSSPLYFIILCVVAASEWLLRKKWSLR